MRTAVLLLGLLLAGAPLPAETYMLLIESSLDGEADPAPPAALEGLMSAMFDSGNVTFDCGPYRPRADWELLRFGEALEIARDGGAHYLATVLLQARSLPAGDGGPAAFAVKARYHLWDPAGGALLGGGELETDNRGPESGLDYEALLFRVGELTAVALQRIAERR